MDQKTKERFYESLEQLPLSFQISWAIDQSGLQNSYSFRALSHARILAQELVDEKGAFREIAINPYFARYPKGYSDETYWDHQLNFLNKWREDSRFVQKFRRFSTPLFHPFAQEVVRWTLDLDETQLIKDFHIKQAAIVACLTPLRQTIGSCFATAPAIDVQQSHLEVLIEDLYELLTRGRIRRIVDGVEYIAPFCLSAGQGDLVQVIPSNLPYFASLGIIHALEVEDLMDKRLSFTNKVKASEKLCQPYFEKGMRVIDLLKRLVSTKGLNAFKNTQDCALLKVWEYTLASYCDIKMEYSHWNLSAAIGLSPTEKGGIGNKLLEALEEKLKDNHSLSQTRYQDCEMALYQLQSTEGMLKSAQTEQDARRLKTEVIVKSHHYRSCKDLYEEALSREKINVHLLQKLLNHYIKQFQFYFQEIYDPDYINQTGSFYQDRAAGFRLVYKHGRSQSSLWTAIYSAEDFISILDDFFKSTENMLLDGTHDLYEKELISEMTTLILHYLHTPDFLKMVLDKAEAKARLPWAYSSGGAVDQIASIYLRKSSTLKHEKKVIKDEMALFTFIIETIKELPPLITDAFIKDQNQALLLQTPTHACRLLPGIKIFSEAWKDPRLTYTWIRDEWLEPARFFYNKQILSLEEQQEIYNRLQLDGPLRDSMTLEEFVKPYRNQYKDYIASKLFQMLPLIHKEECQALLHHPLPKEINFLSSDEFFQYLINQNRTERPSIIRDQMRERRQASPLFLFADTNWAEGYFSFVVNPITLNLEVWKSDRVGLTASPLPLVKDWFNAGEWVIHWG